MTKKKIKKTEKGEPTFKSKYSIKEDVLIRVSLLKDSK